MAQGFLAGALWGTLCGVAILGVASQAVERRSLSFPKPQATAVEVPGGSEFDQARPESDPVVPEAQTRPNAGETAIGVVPPEDVVETPPAFDTTSLDAPRPSLDSPRELGDVPTFQADADVTVTVPEAGQGSGGSASPVLPAPETPGAAPDADTNVSPALPGAAPDTTEAPTVPSATEDAAAPSTDAVAAPAPSTDTLQPVPEAPSSPTIGGGESVAALTAPDAGDAPRVTAAEDAPERPQTVAPSLGGNLETESESAPAAPTTLTAPAAPTGVADAPQPEADDTPPVAPGAMPRVLELESSSEIGNLATNVTTNRLPRIGISNEESSALPTILTPGQDEQADTTDAETVADGLPSGALNAYRAPFEGGSGKPLVSVVLLHEGAEALDKDALSVLPASVAFAVDAANSAAGDIAAAYRAAGREVVLIPTVPEGARPQDVEVALQANFDRVPEAVAIMDASGGGFQANRAAVAQVVDIVGLTGHGLITFPRGLNTAHQRAEQSGIPAGLIFRDLDGDGQGNEQIRRAFDRAAFRARQDEAVILVGRTRPETLAAIREWSLGNRAATVTMAPVSAALIGN